MTIQDALYMMLVAGIRDVRLKEKLSELVEPTLPAFTTIIDAHLHAKATAGNTAVVKKYSLQVETRKARISTGTTAVRNQRR